METNLLDEYVDYSICVVCAVVIDYCLGHGEDGDETWERHDHDDHSLCHPDAECV